MKIAVTSTGKDLDSQVDPRFGRAPYFLIVDSETFAFDIIDNNENMNALKGAGIQAARMVSDKGVEVLLTGFCGPNAFKALKAADIKVANEATGSVKDAVKAYVGGKLSVAEAPNAEAQW
jgi:predicted Fe-Mo cluster-binding NifX family protein